MNRKHRSPYYVPPEPTNVQATADGATFDWAGFSYRADRILYRIEAKQGDAWVRTSSGNVCAAARKALEQTR